MHKIGQLLLLLAVLIIVFMAVLLLFDVIDGKIAGAALVIDLILIGAGSSISKKYQNK